MPIDRRAQRLLDMLAATRGGETSGAPTPLARRAALDGLAEMADSPGAGHVTDAAFDGPAGRVGLRLHAPGPQAEPLPALVFFHGGGWVAGGAKTHDGFCGRLCAAAGIRVIAVDYRLAPEHPFPAAFVDCLAAVQWVAEQSAALGVDPSRLAVGGDSVGGGLAAAVAMDPGAPQLALQVLICPILDVAFPSASREALAEGFFISRSAFERDLADYAPGVARDDPRVSPLRAPGLDRVPPALVHTAEFDPFRDEGEAYAEALRAAGVQAETTRHAGMIHYFYALARAIPYAEAAAHQIGAQIRARLA